MHYKSLIRSLSTVIYVNIILIDWLITIQKRLTWRNMVISGMYFLNKMYLSSYRLTHYHPDKIDMEEDSDKWNVVFKENMPFLSYIDSLQCIQLTWGKRCGNHWHEEDGYKCNLLFKENVPFSLFIDRLQSIYDRHGGKWL